MSRTIITISAVLFLVAVFGGIFLWWPKFEEYLALRDRLDIKTQELEEKTGYFNKLRDFSDKLANYPEELTKINSALSDDPSIPELFNFIQITTSENGLILENLSSGNLATTSSSPESQQKVGKIGFNISVIGSYSAFKNFLTALYKNARLIDVDSISFSANEELGDLFSYTVSLTTYSQSGAK